MTCISSDEGRLLGSARRHAVSWFRVTGGGRGAGRVVWVTCIGVALCGCRREEITAYTAPKDAPAAPAMAEHAPRAKSRPHIHWTLPAGWTEMGPGQMSLAGFSITGSGGEQAQVTITQLGRFAGRDVEIVNMWRDQLGLDPLGREEVERQLQVVSVGGDSGNLFQVEGTPKNSSNKVRIVTAVVHGAEASWFYKLAGDAPLVEAQKPVFIEFLKSIRIQESGGDEPSPPAVASRKPNWQVPPHWTELPAGQMQVAKFSVPGRGNAKAEVSVSIFPNDTGGTLANVNRWRRQLGLAEVQEAESSIAVLDPAVPEAKLVDLANNNRRLLGAIVPREGGYWFYKLLGDAEAVAPEKEAFVRFAQSKP